MARKRKGLNVTFPYGSTADILFDVDRFNMRRLAYAPLALFNACRHRRGATNRGVHLQRL